MIGKNSESASDFVSHQKLFVSYRLGML